MKNEKFLIDIQTKCGNITNEILNATIDAERTFNCKWPYIVLNSPYFSRIQIDFKDTYREKTLENKTPTLSKSMNMNIWLVGTSSQLFETKFLEKGKWLLTKLRSL